MHIHEDKKDMDDTSHGGKLAGKGKKLSKKKSNKKMDRFRKAQAKRS